MPVSALRWGTNFENQVDIGYSLFDILTDREEREGSEHIQSPSGTEDSWVTGRDFVMSAEVRWIPDGPNTNPVQTPLSGPVSWQEFLGWARDANALRFVPDTTVPDFYIDNVYLVEPRKGFGSLSTDIKRNVTIKLRNPTVDFHQALRGIMFEYAPGMSLTDPIVATATRASIASRIAKDLSVATDLANVLRDRHYEAVIRTALLEAGRTNLALRSEALDDATWTKANTTVTANATTAPDGAATADLLLETAVNNSHYAYQTGIIITSGEVVAGSFLIKNGGRFRGRVYVGDIAGTNFFRADFNLTAGTVVTGLQGASTILYGRIVALANGWYRIEIAGNINGGVTSGHLQVNICDDTGATAYPGDITKGLYVWGAQFERGAAFCSSYIPTAAASVARSADVFQWPHAWKPQPIFFYSRFIERGSVTANAGDGPGQIGGGALPYAGFDSFLNPGYRFTHQNANGAAASNASGVPAIGDDVQLLGVINPNGSVQIFQSINGGAPTSGGLSGALAFVPSWVSNILSVNRQNFHGAFRGMKIGPLTFGGLTRDTIAKAAAA